MPVIRWEEPGPEPYRDEDLWAHELVAELQARPGEWAVVLETASPDEAELFLHAISRQRYVWPAVRRRGDLLAIYACWSTTKPEPTSTSATVYSFPTGGEHSQGDAERSATDLSTDEVTDARADPSTAAGKRRWWQK